MIAMYDYIDGLIRNADIIYKKGAVSATPAPDNTYDIRSPDSKEYELLSKEEKEEYHTITIQCLYLSKSGRPDIHQYIAFHCKRVKNPTRDDQKRLSRTIKYLVNTTHLPLILFVNEHGVSEWWVDASYAVNDDIRSRTGAVFSLGEGVIYCASTKQKIVTSSSTEAELVGVADCMPKILCCRHFMEAQECAVEDVYVYQSNKALFCWR